MQKSVRKLDMYKVRRRDEGNMNYDVVNKNEKTVMGISTVTGNQDPDMKKKIGMLWSELYQNGIYEKIQNKANAYAIGLYSDYTKDGYTVTAGAEVLMSEKASKLFSDLTSDLFSDTADMKLVIKKIPAGKYARFSIQGNMETAVAQAWNEIWDTDLDRSYSGDYEEYLNSDMENARIDIYIALK